MVKMYVGLPVKYMLFVSNFIETLIIWTGSRKKYSNTKYLKNYPICSMRTDRRADIAPDMSKLKVTLRNFANPPNNEWIYTSSSIMKVRELRNRPRVAQRIPGGLGSQIS
jgi:hypothetical protein